MSLLISTTFMLVGTSCLFTRLQHPLAMGITLILQTLLVCLSSGSFMWFSYILFLIFLGATLVLFIYVASLASNEMFKLSVPASLVGLIALLGIPTLFFKDELIAPLNPSNDPSQLTPSATLSDPAFELSMIYSPSTSSLTSFMILYLLLTLIVIVKLSSASKSPLRLS